MIERDVDIYNHKDPVKTPEKETGLRVVKGSNPHTHISLLLCGK